jgi:hypothetical protein
MVVFDNPLPLLRTKPFEERYAILIESVESEHPFVVYFPCSSLLSLLLSLPLFPLPLALASPSVLKLFYLTDYCCEGVTRTQ